MTATAIISRTGRAVVRDGETFYVLTSDNPSPRLADATHWMHLRGLHPDAEVLAAGEHPFLEVRARMLGLWREQLGLDLLLIVLDQDGDATFRAETAGELEKLLAKEAGLGETLQAILLSTNAPTEADFPGAIAAAEAAKAARVGELLTKVSEGRPMTGEVSTAWRSALAALESPVDQTAAMAIVQRSYALGRAVIALRAPDPGAWIRFRTFCLAHRLAPTVVDQWLSSLGRNRVPTKGPVPISAYPRTSAPSWLARRSGAQPPPPP
jgi:hypothetical protein